MSTFSTLIRQLHRLTTQAPDDTEAFLQEVIETGSEIFGLSTGLVSQIDGDVYTIRAAHPADGDVQAGAQFDLADTYCQWVMQEQSVVAHASADAAVGHPVHQHPPLASYISAPIWVNGQIYGTLNFSDVTPRGRDFAPEEREIIEVMAQSIGQFLERIELKSARQQADRALQRNRERLDLAVAGADIGLWDWNLATGHVAFNEQWAQMLGFPLAKINPHIEAWAELVHPDDRPHVMAAWDDHLAGETAMYEATHRMRCRDGAWRWVLTRGKVVERAPDGTPLRATGIHQDITERKQAEHERQQLREEYEAVFENAQDAIFFFEVHQSDGDLRFTLARLNPTHERSTGLSEEELRGQTPREILGDEMGAAVEANYRRCVEARTALEYEEELLLPTGMRTWHTKISPVIVDGEVTHIVGVARDTTMRKALEEHLYHQAHHDALTGLPNRKAFFQRCTAAIEAHAESGMPYAVLFMDLDRFKKVNDSLGHQAGDALLKALARRIRQRVREDDVVARLGGDEFGVLLQSTGDPDAIEHVAARIAEGVKDPFELEAGTVHTAVSIGMVQGRKRHRAPEDLLREADMAMYHAKERGDGPVFFDPNLGEQVRTQFFLEADLYRALREDELRVFYQPVIRMADGGLAGFEALVRWQHPERGLLAPGAFIDVAEKTGLVVDLDRWMIRAACRQAQQWRDRAASDFVLLLHVNCSHRTFLDASLTDYVAQVLGETDLAPTHLALEITERTLVEDVDAVTDEMQRFKDQQVRLCIDDFGVKYSSLGILHQLPVDAIKVDRRFVHQIDAPEPNDGFVRAIADLAHGLDLSLVAEGIESPRQLAVTRELGYQLGQGFLMAHPLDVEAATACISGEQPWRRHWTDASPDGHP